MIQPSRFDIGYIMGLVIGEGSFTSSADSQERRVPRLSVKMIVDDRAPLDMLAAFLGGKVYGPYQGKTCQYCLYVLRGAALNRSLPLFVKYLPASRKRRQFVAWLTLHFPGRFIVDPPIST